MDAMEEPAYSEKDTAAARDARSALRRFEDLARKLVQVPKKEITAADEKRKKRTR